VTTEVSNGTAEKSGGGQFLFEFAFLPNKVRRACDVPQSECENCALSTEDHTVGFAFENKNYRKIYPDSRVYLLVCVKDYRAHYHVVGKVD